MTTPSDYDSFADIYHIWARSAPTTERNLPFYVEEYVRTPGPVVELGVGNGRIAVEAAKQGKPIIGVDSSVEMLKRCRRRAEEAGVAHLLTLIHADFQDFVLPEPAQLITIPFHTIGHLLRLDDKRAGLRHIYNQLAPGGRLIFDHFVFDPETARQHQGVGLREEYTDDVTGHDVLMWTTTCYDYDAQTMRIIVWTDELADDGTLLQRKYRRLNFSWLEPQQARTLLVETGFEIVALYGEFDRRPFDGRSPEQVWVAQKPG
jgi:ubiquinone/menaquinone biosynthesis C-methylase UbiE